MRHLRTKTAMSLTAALLLGAPSLQATAPAAPPQAAIVDDLSLADLLNIKLQTGSFLELDLAKSPLSMTIIDRNKIDLAGARDLSELMEIYVPGFQVAVNKWNGKIWMMRGITADRNTKFIVLVNGHKMNTQARDGFIQEQAMGLLGDIERVEVLRGPAGLVYGAGALAGIVNIVTREATANGAEVRARAGSWGNMNQTSSAVQGMVFGKIADNQSVTASLGWEKSDGAGLGQSRIYGHPQGLAPALKSDGTYAPGIPSNGSAGATPGNWKASMDYNINGVRLYGRATHQVQTAGQYSNYDPWSQYNGQVRTWQLAVADYKKKISDIDARMKAGTATSVDSLNKVNFAAQLAILQTQNITDVIIDGRKVSPTDTFWQYQNDGSDLGRKQYVSDNIMADASYDLPIGENTLKLRAGFDGNSNIIQRVNAVGYQNADPLDRGTFVAEAIGERRYTLGATYLMKNLPKLQIAAGVEQRWDDIGEDLQGRNFTNVAKHPAVGEVLYSNTALFTEGWWDALPNLGVDFGLRWDGHTRTIDNGGTLNGKLAGVYTVAQGHIVKLIFQSSSNNGLADYYEPGRNMYNDNGQLFDSWHFDNAYDTTSNIIPGVPASAMHELKPENVYSFELTSNDDLGHGFSVSPSVSYNMVRDLFAWVSKPAYRGMNIGRYDNLNIDLQGNYESKYLDVGLNHAIQWVVNTSLTDQAYNWVGPNFLNAKFMYDPATGKSVARPGYYQLMPDGTYQPIPRGDTVIVKNPVVESYTSDGTNFIGIATHLTKVYADVKPTKWLTLHSDVRVFWGIPGRDSGLSLDASQGYDVANANTDPITKWNASMHAKLPGDWTVGLYIYDILGINSPDYAANTLRWFPVAAADRDLFGVDLRSYAIDIKKSF